MGADVECGNHRVIGIVPVCPGVVCRLTRFVHPEFVVDFIVTLKVVHAGNDRVLTGANLDCMALEG